MGGAPATSIFSSFTGLTINVNDLQIGYYSATFDGTNWVVTIPPRRFKSAVINWTASTATSIAASGINIGDYATCSFSNTAGVAMTTGNYWRQSILVRTGIIDVVAVITGTPPAITGISCLVQK